MNINAFTVSQQIPSVRMYVTRQVKNALEEVPGVWCHSINPNDPRDILVFSESKMQLERQILALAYSGYLVHKEGVWYATPSTWIVRKGSCLVVRNHPNLAEQIWMNYGDDNAEPPSFDQMYGDISESWLWFPSDGQLLLDVWRACVVSEREWDEDARQTQVEVTLWVDGHGSRSLSDPAATKPVTSMGVNEFIGAVKQDQRSLLANGYRFNRPMSLTMTYPK